VVGLGREHVDRRRAFHRFSLTSTESMRFKKTGLKNLTRSAIGPTALVSYWLTIVFQGFFVLWTMPRLFGHSLHFLYYLQHFPEGHPDYVDISHQLLAHFLLPATPPVHSFSPSSWGQGKVNRALEITSTRAIQKQRLTRVRPITKTCFSSSDLA
jgi:hypothetical protein